jgi:hypothetical protein
MDLAIMHIDNRVESLEEARKYLDLMCNNQYVIILFIDWIFKGLCTNQFPFSIFTVPLEQTKVPLTIGSNRLW